MPFANIKRRESVLRQGIAKLKRRQQKTVYGRQQDRLGIIDLRE